MASKNDKFNFELNAAVREWRVGGGSKVVARTVSIRSFRHLLPQHWGTWTDHVVHTNVLGWLFVRTWNVSLPSELWLQNFQRTENNVQYQECGLLIKIRDNWGNYKVWTVIPYKWRVNLQFDKDAFHLWSTRNASFAYLDFVSANFCVKSFWNFQSLTIENCQILLNDCIAWRMHKMLS